MFRYLNKLVRKMMELLLEVFKRHLNVALEGYSLRVMLVNPSV